MEATMKEIRTRKRKCGPIVFAVTITILAAASGTVEAHDWYPYSCCSDKDCRPVMADAVRYTPAGWQIRLTGETIPFRKTRHSPDGQFHICSYGGLPEARTVCFFAPDFGS
jgi:hypothetical protein